MTMNEWTPPEENTLTFGKLKKPELPDTKRAFEFNPDRPAHELAVLNATGEVRDPQSGLIRFWSHSALQKFQICPYSMYLKRVMKIKEESGPAAERGNLIHDQAEKYVDGRSEQLPDAKKVGAFETRFNVLREEYAKGHVGLEQDWGFTADWEPLTETGRALYKNPQLWAIMKLDVFHWESATSARIIDHKSGKLWGNEVKHAGQGMEYTIAAFMRYPQLEHITVDFWYLDQGQDRPRTYTRADAMLLEPRTTERALKLTTANEQELKKANPSQSNCKWCFYKKEGICEYAYED